MIRGVVLCGGESKRMGKDKGLLPLGNDNWAQIAFHKLQKLSIPVCLSVNPNQLLAYGHFFSADQLIKDETSAKGPLRGLLSVHLKYPNDDLLLLACDMTEMDAKTLETLIHSAITSPGFDYYVYTKEDFIEPLCALYSAKSLKNLYLDLGRGNLSDFSMYKLIKKDNYKTIPITNLPAFRNHNTPTI